MKPYLIFLAVMALVSLVAFFAYGLDKRKAKKGSWRTKESVLLGLAFFGGAVGALLGMKVFHHKTKHWYFWVVGVLGLSWQCALFFYLLLNF
jgi:uncharacterized membrane protein YsdA (DUF1294 family)